MGIVLLVVLSVSRAYGQEREIDIFITNILEFLSEEGLDTDEITTLYQNLYNHPLDLNRAGYAQLADLLVLSEVQIESLLWYIENYGELKSLYELYHVPSFDSLTIKLIKPFVLINIAGIGKRQVLAESNLKWYRVLKKRLGYMPIDEISFKKNPDSRYISTPDYLLTKNYLTVGNTSIGLIFEKDPGEAIFTKGNGLSPEFCSFFLKTSLGNRVENLIVGDFNARFSQGLVLWNGLNFSSNSINPTDKKKRESRFTPYMSANENSSIRGVAVTLVFGNLKYSVATGVKNGDAKSDSLNFYTIYETGLHNTPTTIRNKNKFKETLIINNLSLTGKNFTVGLTHQSTYQPLNDCRNLATYNESQRIKHWSTNISSNFGLNLNGLLFYGELAIDSKLIPATILGILDQRDYDNVYGVNIRSYSNNYNSPHSNALSRGSYPNSESGIALNYRHITSSKWKISSMLDFTLFHKERYRAYKSSVAIVSKIEIETPADAKFNIVNSYQFQRRYFNYKLSDISTILAPEDLLSIKLITSKSLGDNLRIRIKTQINKSFRKEFTPSIGSMIFGEITINLPIKFSTFTTRVIYFNVKDWENRIYIAEGDVGGSVVNQIAYGRGYKGSIMIKTGIIKSIKLWLKYSLLYYSSKSSIGEGLDYINGPKKDEVKAEISWTF